MAAEAGADDQEQQDSSGVEGGDGEGAKGPGGGGKVVVGERGQAGEGGAVEGRQ